MTIKGSLKSRKPWNYSYCFLRPQAWRRAPPRGGDSADCKRLYLVDFKIEVYPANRHGVRAVVATLLPNPPYTMASSTTDVMRMAITDREAPSRQDLLNWFLRGCQQMDCDQIGYSE